MFEISLSDDAKELYRQANHVLAKKLARCFKQLEYDPNAKIKNIKKLTGKFAGTLRYRVGEWRVIYSIDFKVMKVEVHLIAHRKDAYE